MERLFGDGVAIIYRKDRLSLLIPHLQPMLRIERTFGKFSQRGVASDLAGNPTGISEAIKISAFTVWPKAVFVSIEVISAHSSDYASRLLNS